MTLIHSMVMKNRLIQKNLEEGIIEPSDNYDDD